MDGARAEEAAARDMVARLGPGTVSPWTVAGLFLLGDKAVPSLEELARGDFGPALGSRILGAKLLAAIGTPSARAALRRVLAACAALNSDAGDHVVSRDVASPLGEVRPQRLAVGSRVGGAIEMRGNDGAP
jgi:hypothetical protein